MPEAASKEPVTSQRIMEMTWGFAPPLMISAGVNNGVFELLAKGPKTMAEVASATGISQRGAKALLEGLVGLGFLHWQNDRFSLAEEATAFLVPGGNGYLGGVVQHITGQLLEVWTKLPTIVRTGKPGMAVNQQKQGAEFFSKFVEDLFHLNLGAARVLADDLAKRCQSAFPSGKINVLDIAAGSGVWGIALLQRLPQAQMAAADWAGVTPITHKVAQQQKVGDRVRSIDGDLLETDFGTGYHVATLGHILHSEGEARSRRLLKKVFDALTPGGIIAIPEFVVNDDRCGPTQPLIFALNMLANTDEGDAYTFPQLSQWLRETGFEQVDKIPTPPPSTVVTAVKPGASVK